LSVLAPGAGDRDHPLQYFVVGRKRSGKSEYTYRLWDTWDGDRVVVDVTGDFIGKHPEPDTVTLPVPPPARWPEELRKDDQRMSLRYVPDIKAPDWQADCDRVVGLAYDHGDTLLVVEEVSAVGAGGLPFPRTRQALHHGGHVGLYIIANGPRAKGIDPLWIAQADEVVVFPGVGPLDRKRIAECINWDARDFDQRARNLGQYEHLRYVAGLVPPELWECGPLPLAERQTTAERYVDEHQEA